MIRVAINGLGKLGRAVFNITLETPEIKLVAINDLVQLPQLADQLNRESNEAQSEQLVTYNSGHLLVDNDMYLVFNIPDPIHLPWDDLVIDIILDCSHQSINKNESQKHLQAGAKRVIMGNCSHNGNQPTDSLTKHGNLVKITDGDDSTSRLAQQMIQTAIELGQSRPAPIAHAIHDVVMMHW